MMLETDMLQKLPVRNNLWVSDNKTSMYDCWQLYRMVYGFLFTVSKKNFKSVGGFCEDLVDWGYDDTFFTALCIEKNIKIIPVPSAHCLHIWHDIRKPTQWEDGRKNRERINKYFVMKRTSYLDKDFEERKICEYRFDLINQENVVTSKYKLPNFSTLEKARIHYKLGKLEESFALYNKTEEKLQTPDYESYFDIIIRLNKESEFRHYNNEYEVYSRYYYFILARFYFTKEFDINSLERKGVESKYMKYLFDISSEEHVRRAEQYFYNEQWYLSLRDFFAAYLLGNRSAKKKCDLCSDKIKGI
jgi:hypothetical protein